MITILTKTLPVVHGIDEDETVRVVLLHHKAGVVVRLDLHQAELGHHVVHVNSQEAEGENSRLYVFFFLKKKLGLP